MDVTFAGFEYPILYTARHEVRPNTCNHSLPLLAGIYQFVEHKHLVCCFGDVAIIVSCKNLTNDMSNKFLQKVKK